MGRKLGSYPGDRPGGLKAAFRVQDAMARAMAVPVAGWKVGLTSARAQALCGVDRPLAGPVLADAVHESGVSLANVEGDLGVLEAEIGFRMGRDLPPQERPYTRAEVAAAIGTVMPVIEWVNKRLPGGLMDAVEWIVADGVINRALICGEARGYAPGMDLSAETVRVLRSGAQVKAFRPKPE